MQKRAEMGLTLTLLLIVGILVTGFLIYGFQTNWVMFSSYSSDNVLETIRLQCVQACSKGEFGNHGFCEEERELILDAKTRISGTCYTFSQIKSGPFVNLISECSSVSCIKEEGTESPRGNSDEQNELVSSLQANSELDKDNSIVFQSEASETSLSEQFILSGEMINIQKINQIPAIFQMSESDIYLSRDNFAKLGVNVGDRINKLGVRLSSALILFQFQYGIQITGVPDKTTLAKMDELIKNNKKVILPTEWTKPSPIKEGTNGAIDVSKLVVLPTIRTYDNGKKLYLGFAERNTAIAWAFMVRAALSDANFNDDVNRLALTDADCGYRSYYHQVQLFLFYAWKCPGSAEANEPRWKKSSQEVSSWISSNKNCQISESTLFNLIGSGKILEGNGDGNHGFGVALDMSLQDPGSLGQGRGLATTNRLKWLEKNHKKFGFCPYVTNKGKTPYSYGETWHWIYKGNTTC